jgi:hypothetical protein
MGVSVDLVQSWSNSGKTRNYTVPTSVRLVPAVDCKIQGIRRAFPNLTQTQIINDLLLDALGRLDFDLKSFASSAS